MHGPHHPPHHLRIARCGAEPKNRLERYRWVVERTLSWLNRFQRLEIRYEYRADILLAFLQLGLAAWLRPHLPAFPRRTTSNHIQPHPTREDGRPGPPRTASATLGT